MSGVSEGMGSYRHVLAVQEQADAWFARLMAPDCTAEEWADCKTWCSADPMHLETYLETEHLWELVGGLEQHAGMKSELSSALDPESGDIMAEWAKAIENRRRPTNPARGRWQIPASIAASLLAVVIGWRSVETQESPPQQYVTQDATEEIQLADGSKVTLDVGTSLQVSLKDGRRDLKLVQGRAVFKVAHDASRPFIVDAGPGRVTALGTEFQVQRLGDVLSVTLIEGSVAIDSSPESADRRSLQLTPGQKANYASAAMSWTVSAVDLAAQTSWSHGFHIFSDTPLEEAIAEINRYSRIKLALEGSHLAGLRLSGSFKLGDGSVTAQALPYALPVKIAKDGDRIVISKR